MPENKRPPALSVYAASILLGLSTMTEGSNWTWGSELLFRLKQAGIQLTRDEVAALLAQEGTFESNRNKGSVLEMSPLAVAIYCADIWTKTMRFAPAMRVPMKEEAKVFLPLREQTMRENLVSDLLERLRPVYGESVDSFAQYLRYGGFYSDPASTKYHLSEMGGLCKHTLNVLYRLHEFMAPQTQQEVIDLILAALCHDLCKNGAYESRCGKYYWADKMPFGHGRKSLYIASSFFPTMPEYVAIAIDCHMNERGDKTERQMYNNPLACFLHLADVFASNIDEV